MRTETLAELIAKYTKSCLKYVNNLATLFLCGFNMPLQYWIHDCAMEILGVEELHLDLRNYLDDIETNAGLVRGSIQSRQIVALAIVNYLDRKELMRQIKLLQTDIDRLQGNTGANEGWTDWRIS